MKKELKAMTMERRQASTRLAKVAGKKSQVPTPTPAPTDRKVRSNRHVAEPQPLRPVTA